MDGGGNVKRVEYWLLSSEELKAYREWVQKRLELTEKIYKRYDRLLWDVNNQLEETELNEYKTEQWLQEQHDKMLNENESEAHDDPETR